MFLYGELSVVISAMAVWMDLKDASVDNGWILFSFMIGYSHLYRVVDNTSFSAFRSQHEVLLLLADTASFLYSI